MKITYKDLRIKDNKPYGFVVQKKVGTQWKHPSYFLQLGQAVNELFDRYVRESLPDAKLDLETQQAREVAQSLADKLDDIHSDILEACNAG